MVKISIITLFPQMVGCFLKESIVKRAVEKELVEINLVDLRHFTTDKHGTVDDRPYGGGAGMVLKADVVWEVLNKLKVKSDPSDYTQGFGGEQFGPELTAEGLSRTGRLQQSRTDHPEQSRTDEKLKRKNTNRKQKIKEKTILTSPKGEIFDQSKAREYSKLDQLIIIAGHYEGVDERVLNFVDEEVSLGDFVLTGGEIAAAAIVDAIVRLIPKVLKKKEATKRESFFEVSIARLLKIVGEDETLKKLKKRGIKKIKLLEYPHYTRPEVFKGLRVPDVLLSGDHQKIEKWRLRKAYEETLKKRRDLFSI